MFVRRLIGTILISEEVNVSFLVCFDGIDAASTAKKTEFLVVFYRYPQSRHDFDKEICAFHNCIGGEGGGGMVQRERFD